MIQDISNFGHSGVSTANMRTGEPLRSDSSLFESANTRLSPETLEEEISRLTWRVVDGHASAEERHRLTELVGVQHRSRAG